MQSQRNLPLALLLVAVFLTYANSFGNAFHFDDFHTVVDNPAIRSLANLPRILTDTTAFSVLPANQTYRPVVTASLALDYALGRGYVPFWFHLSTMLWYLVCVVLLYRWAQILFDRTAPGPDNRWWALGVAAWFGLHPVMAETVNYVIQRGDLYCTLGCLAGLVLFATYPAARRYGIYLLPFTLAMLSKPPAAVFPLLLLLYVFFFDAAALPATQRWRVSLAGSLPALAVTGALLWVEAAMTPKSYAPTILSASAYRLTQPYVWMRYCGALFLPTHLSVDTDLQAFETVNGRALAGFAFVCVLVTTSVLCARHRRWYPVAYGLLWFGLTQLPTSGYALSEVENDHRMFFSFPGLMLAVVWSLRLAYDGLLRARPWPQSFRRGVPASFLALGGLLLCVYASAAHRRNAVWHDEASLWADNVKKSPHNGRGLMIYGLTRMNQGDYPGALALFQQALVYTPNYPTLEINLGVVNGQLAETGQPALRQTAESHFLRAIALAPGDDLPHAYYGRWLLHQQRLQEATAQLQVAVGLNEQRPMQRDLLIHAEEQSGDLGAAKALAQTTLALIPGDATAMAALHANAAEPMPAVAARINASLAAYRAGQYQQSIDEAREALTLEPRSAEAWNNIGAGYGAMRQWDLAIDAERKALQLEPRLSIAANNLRWFVTERAGNDQAGPPRAADTKQRAREYVNRSLVLSEAGQPERSIEAAREALRLDPKSAEAWNNIAAGDEALGRWDEAIEAARHALELRPDFLLAKNNLAWSLQQKAHAGR